MENQPKHNEKENFQLERIALFSDAVFAIAITLLIIEIKVPEIHSQNVTDTDLGENLRHMIPKFVGFIVSFFVIGLYWLAHHRMFKYVILSNQKLLWNNLLFLLPIVIMPFSTAFFSEYYKNSLRLPLGIYTITICLAGLFSFRLWRVIGNPKNKLSSGLNSVILNYNSTRALVIPLVFIIAFLLSFFTKWSFIIPPLAPLATKLINAYFKNKHPEIMKTHYS